MAVGSVAGQPRHIHRHQAARGDADRRAPRIDLVLSLSALVVTVLLAVPLGVLAAWRHNTLVDRVVMIYAVIGFSLPSFVVGTC